MTSKKPYNTFCLNVINVLINKLDLRICYINKSLFIDESLSCSINGQSDLIKDKIVTRACAFILKNKTTNYIFSFGHQGLEHLQRLSNHIFSIDNNKYRNIHIIIFRNSEELDEARQVNKANVYKRSFFTSFDIICEQAIEIDPVSCEHLFSDKWAQCKSIHQPKNTAGIYKIEIIDNIPVGKENFRLYKLRFKSEVPIDILPGQFIMVCTLKEQQQISKHHKPTIRESLAAIIPDIQNNLGTKQLSYLKRPFGIYRTYYDNYSPDYISRLSIEKELAAMLYTVKPNVFEIVYKVLEKGVGTNELTRLTKGDKVEILAPLGKVFDLRKLAKEDIDEVHIIGGGVGIAPLVYLVQLLRFFNFNVKAFIGIENFNSLIYTKDNGKRINSHGSHAKIYIDDLKSFGLSEVSDIYVSLLCNTKEQIKGVKNVFKGSLVTEPYAAYLKKNNHLRSIAFSCGPLPMMQKVHDITAQYNLKSYVLMEKRMACGIGVCFSCVCKIIENGENHYSRVCIDGPILESKQINWNE
ncbi:MAG: hypothetical protein JW973_02850 [Bacteroidales bacterium]|nr:hypothetical protein [Bacteroidales bacterium]